MLKDQQPDMPQCFGHLYDSRAKECVGGFDIAFTGENGSHVREKCNWTTACSARVQAKQQVIPTSNLLRAHQTQFQTTNAPAPSYTRPSLPTAPPLRPYGAPPPNVAPAYGHPQHVGMQQMVPVNYGIPQYLSVREPSTSGGLSKRLGRELVRSMGKSLGHTLANFFDTEIFGHKPDRGEPGQQ